MKINDTIKKYRADIGLSQAEFSNKIDLTRSTLAMIESGKTENPTDDTLRKICGGLNISLSRLNIDTLSDDDKKLSDTIVKLTNDKKVEWLRLSENVKENILNALIYSLGTLETGYNINELTDLGTVNEFVPNIDKDIILNNTVYFKVDNNYFVLTMYNSNYKANDVFLFVINDFVVDTQLICTGVTNESIEKTYFDIKKNLNIDFGINKKSLIDKLKSL